MMRLFCLRPWVWIASVLAIIAALTASPVLAAETLLIPFQCAASGDRVLARPSRDQSLAILGQRTTEPYRACPSDGSGGCRTLMLHKFDIDCSGKRVSWQELYAAISKVTTRGAEFDRGKLIVMVRPGRESRSSPRDRYDRQPRRRRSAPFPVEMPDGFAPVTGTVARFAGTPDRTPQGAFARNEPPPDRSAHSPRQNQPAPKTVDEAPRAAIIAEPSPAAEPKTATGAKTIEVPKPTAPAAKAKLPTVITPSVSAKPDAAKAEPKDTIENKSQAEPADMESVAAVPAAPLKPTVINVPETVGKATKLPTLKSEKSKQPVASEDPSQAAKIAAATETTEQTKNEGVVDAASDTEPTGSKTDVIAGGAGNIYADSDPQSQTPPAPSYGAPTLGATMLVLIIVATLLTLLWAFYRRMTHRRAPMTRPLRTALPVSKSSYKNNGLAADVRGEAKAKSSPKKTSDDFSARRSEPALPLSSVAAATTGKTDAPVPGKAKPSTRLEPVIADSQETTTDPFEPRLTLSKPGPCNPNTRLEFSAKTPPTLPMPDPAPLSNKLDAEALTIRDEQMGPGVPAHVTPQTRDEALSTLGVSSKAGPDVIEKVVDGLRESWKTELAIDEVDKRHRQERLAQIEAAWQLLRDERAATGKTNGAGVDHA
jgi:hypothetical protein